MDTKKVPSTKLPRNRTTRLVSRQACLFCRERKIKCDGVHVCRNCKQLNVECVFVKSNRGGSRKRKNLTEANNQSQIAPASTEPATSSVPVTPQNEFNSAALTSYPTSDNSLLSSSLDVIKQDSPYTPMLQYEVATTYGTESTPIFANLNNSESVQSPQANIFDNDKHRAAIEDSQLALNDIQKKVDSLKSVVPQLMTAYDNEHALEVFKMFPSDPQQLFDLDLPPIEIVLYFKELYYEYFHFNHSFLLPKSAALPIVSLKTDVGIFHAMFAVACRFTEDEKCAELGVHPYMRDSFYWIAQFEKHRKDMFPFLLMKSMLLIGTAYVTIEGSSSLSGIKIIQEALQVYHWYNLDKKHYCTTYELTEADSERTLRSFTPLQLMLRESHLRSIWELWRFQLQLALLNNDVNLAPAFNGNLCLPAADYHYNSEFRNWDYKYSFWHDIEMDLLNACNKDMTPPQSGGFDEKDLNSTSISRTELYSSPGIFIITANLLSLTFKLTVPFNEDFAWDIESRLQLLYSKIPRLENSDLSHGCGYTMSLGCIFCTIMILNSTKAAPFLVYLRERKMVNGKYEDIMIQNIDKLDAFLLSEEKDVDACNSYLVCQWSAFAMCSLLQAANPDNDKNLDHETWKHYPPMMGFLLYWIATTLANEIALQQRMRRLGLPQLRHRADTSDLSQFPDSKGHNIAFTNKYGEHNWPIGFVGDISEFRSMLDRLDEIIRFQARLWPCNEEFVEHLEIIKNHIDSL